MSAPSYGFGLTSFLVKLLRYSVPQLAAADADRAAQHYGISRDHAAGYISQQRQLRGIGGPA